MVDTIPISVVIPTYRREAVLLATIDHLLGLHPNAAEILVVDQTATHEAATHTRLQQLEDAGEIRWLRLNVPSITAAMNHGLSQARHELVLFLDDDVIPEPELLNAHVQAHTRHPDGLVAGRVIQPWEEGLNLAPDGPFRFASTRPAVIEEFMGGNFSIRRGVAIQLGGFDENFVRVAYRFEAEFARRYRLDGRRIQFEPRACLHHLKELAGGTRTFGEHLTTWRPDHAVGAYYYALRIRNYWEFVARPWHAVATRYHLRHPWRIPGTLVAELRGMVWALRLFLRGPKRMKWATKDIA